jgi:hypothetical protein
MEIQELNAYRIRVTQEAEAQWSFACFYILSSIACYGIYSFFNSYTFFCCLWITTYLIGHHHAKSSMLNEEIKGINSAIEEKLEAFKPPDFNATKKED